MRILVVGAGAIGGYFGGRLVQAGRDVTFLVRERRAAELAATGLVIDSAAGNFVNARPSVVLAAELDLWFELIILSCEAYSLDDAINALAPAVGPDTAILPLLNGMRQLDVLEARFGAGHVLGGQCAIAATLGAAGQVVHLNATHELSFGERDGVLTERVEAIAEEMRDAVFTARASRHGSACRRKRGRKGVHRAGEPAGPARNVGEMGVSERACRRHLPDARGGGRHRAGAGRNAADGCAAR